MVRRRTETVGQRIRRLRDDKGVSLRDLGEPGMSDAYICRIELGQRDPSLRVIRKLAPKLGVSPLYLETGRDEVEVVLSRDVATELLSRVQSWMEHNEEHATDPIYAELASALQEVTYFDEVEAAHGRPALEAVSA